MTVEDNRFIRDRSKETLNSETLILKVVFLTLKMFYCSVCLYGMNQFLKNFTLQG